MAPVLGERPYGKRQGRVLLTAFYDPNGITTILENIHTWQLHSRYEIVVFNFWPGRGGFLELPSSLSLEDFDAVVVHPTASYHAANLANLDRNLSPDFAAYEGVKVLMKQDEQVSIGQFVKIIIEKKFDLVFTCVPVLEQEKVYPRALIGDCDLMQVLTGYVSPAMRRSYGRTSRDIDISYRGSIQPLEFGRLSYEKRGIGYDVSGALGDRDLRLDISSRWEDRVLGEEWARFLSRSRTVLGVESGSNLFDFDGKVAQWCRRYEAEHEGEDRASERYYRRAHETFLHLLEGNVDYAQISPRHFEAAAAGAAQILYEGQYSGIFRAREHFMPLRRDLGNLPEVVDFIRDETQRSRMAERTFEEVILEKRNWYETFVADADNAIECKLFSKGRLSAGRNRSLLRSDSSSRPTAYVLAAHDPVLDPRIGWVASSLAESHEVCIIGTYDFGVVGDGPTSEVAENGITVVRVERTKHDAAWLPSLAQMRTIGMTPRAVLATLAGFAALPVGLLADRIGAHGAAPEEIARFRSLCTYFVNTNSALIQAAENMGPPDLVVAADLETLPAATAIAAGAGGLCIYDAHEYWPFSYTDFRNWEIEFWLEIDRQLSRLADLRYTVSDQLAQIMTRQYGCEFLTLPNCAQLAEGKVVDFEGVLSRRGGPGPLKLLFLGNFAEGRGLEETVRAFAHVKTDAKLILQGCNNSYREKIMELAGSLGLGEERVSFPPAVSESELIETAAEADIGLIPYNPAYFTYRHCCPNKLSQYLAAGLPILSSPTEYVAGIVKREEVGFVVDIADPIAYAATIDDLSRLRPELKEIGRRARKFFEERYHWEAFVGPLVARIEQAEKNRSRIGHGIDVDWIPRAVLRNQRHGEAGHLPSNIFGASLADPSPEPSEGSSPERQFSAPERQLLLRGLRRAWRLIPASGRYAVAGWLRRHL
jgi:glycosyltransferase involved in cell wall biosynthesis